MQAVFEIALHLGTFKNIDLGRQGLYHVRASFHSGFIDHYLDETDGQRDAREKAEAKAQSRAQSSGQAYETPLEASRHGPGVTFARPYHIVNPRVRNDDPESRHLPLPYQRYNRAVVPLTVYEDPAFVRCVRDRGGDIANHASATSAGSGDDGVPAASFDSRTPTDDLGQLEDHLALAPASLDVELSTFQSSTFRVQFEGQDAFLNDTCVFRLCLPAREHVPLYLDLQLMFHAFSGEQFHSGAPIPDGHDFDVVSTRTYALLDVWTRATHAFYPCTFDDQHFCQVNATVHTLLCSFRPETSVWDGRSEKSWSPAATLTRLLYPRLPVASNAGVSHDTPSEPASPTSSSSSSSSSPVPTALPPATQFAPAIVVANQFSRAAAAGVATSMPEAVYTRAQCLDTGARHYAVYVQALVASHDALQRTRVERGFDADTVSQRLGASHPLMDILKDAPRAGPLTGDLALLAQSADALASPAAFAERFELDTRATTTGELCALIGKIIVDDVERVTHALFDAWLAFVQCLPVAFLDTRLFSERDGMHAWQNAMRERMGAYIFRNKIVDGDKLALAAISDAAAKHSHVAGSVRSPGYEAALSYIGLEDTCVFRPHRHRTFIFEDAYEESISATATTDDKSASSSSSSSASSPSSPTRAAVRRRAVRGDLPFDPKEREYEGKHLIVLVHGYQGNSWDMRLLSNTIAFLEPDVLTLCSQSNENDTEGDIAEMGRRLAIEVATFIVGHCYADLARLSFIGHSLGGIIVRQALLEPELEPYHSLLFTYLSLASPHCGYLFSDSSVLDIGIWALTKWTKSLCLSQLSLTDHEDPMQCFMTRLAAKPVLHLFQHVFVAGSMQDKYVPFHSARIEMHTTAVRSRKFGPAYTAMVRGLLSPLTNRTLFKRFSVSFSIRAPTSLDTTIGRTAHIYFLDNQCYMLMLMLLYKEYFV